MARMRTLKPEACSSESLAAVPREVRWTFATFWTHCDDDGRAAWNTRLIKAAIYPLDDDVTLGVLEQEFAELEAVGAVCFYDVDGRHFVHVPQFGQHQHPNRKADSKLPPCPKDDHSPPAHTQRSEGAVSPHAPLTPVVVGEGHVVVEGDVVGAPSAPAPKRGTRLPADWKPSPEGRAWTLERYTADVAALELEKFRNHWISKTGKDATKLDWNRTWQNWLLNGRSSGRAADESTADRRVNQGLALAATLRADERKELPA